MYCPSYPILKPVLFCYILNSHASQEFSFSVFGPFSSFSSIIRVNLMQVAISVL